MQLSSHLDARFWDNVAQKYSKRPVPDEDAYRATLDRVRSRLTPGDQVLEIGCGTGTTALELAPYAQELVASDLSTEMIAIAQGKARDQGVTNVRFVPGTVADFEPKAHSFAVVMAFNLLHLVKDIPASLRRVHDIIKPGGLFISKTPCVGESSFLLRGVIKGMQCFGKAPFLNFVKKSELEAAVKGAGFEIIETGLYPAKSHSLYLVGQKAH